MGIQGVIRPPPEIRAVADRTALYVAKNGRAFESRILGSEKGKTPKFAFLRATSPFHAYYEQRIKHYEDGGSDDNDDDKKDESKKKEDDSSKIGDDNEKENKNKSKEGKEIGKTAATASAATGKKSVIDPVAKIILEQRSKISKIRAAQEEARKAAANTKVEDGGGGGGGDDHQEKKMPAAPIPVPLPMALQFVNIVAPSSLSVAQIEKIQLVAQFTALDGKHNGSFLSQLSIREWNNPAFAFCQPRHGHFAYFSALVDAYRHVLESWKDGGVKQVGGDGVHDLANNVNKCLEVAAYRSEYDRDREIQANKDQDNAAASTVAQIDWHNFVVVETIDFPADEVVEVSMMPPPPPPAPVAAEAPAAAAAAAAKNDGMEESDSDEDEEQIRVVPTYQHKVVGQASTLETVIDPITGKEINVKDMPEHMRIQLLDPKWAEERKKFQDKQKESNLVSGDMVASNLERLAQARGGSGKQDLLTKESDPKKRLEEANRIIRAQQQSAVGPSLPSAPPRNVAAASAAATGVRHAAPHQPSIEPPAKRSRVDVVTTTIEAPPMPGQTAPATGAVTGAYPAPPVTTTAVTEDPFAAAATTAAVPNKEGPKTLLPASEFAASLSEPSVTLQVRIPNDPMQMAYNFYGQVVALTTDVMSTVKAAKQELAKTHLNSINANKIQLKNTSTGTFLKDSMTLAALNIGPTATLELVPRARGGRK